MPGCLPRLLAPSILRVGVTPLCLEASMWLVRVFLKHKLFVSVKLCEVCVAIVKNRLFCETRFPGSGDIKLGE